MSYLPATSVGKSLATAASASAGRSTLGLGTIATQDANNVAITGGTITGVSLVGSEVIRLVTGSDSITAADEILMVNNTSGAASITLPAATGSGKVYTVKRTVTSTSDVTIDPNSSELIDGAATFVLSTAGESITFVDAGSGVWAIF